jgi:hypothetical protein
VFTYDVHGALQFAWSGGGRGQLLECTTFNDLGLDAFNRVGRDGLWVDLAKMLDVVKAHPNDPHFLNDPLSGYAESQTLELASSLVARTAFTSRPCKWYYVELVNDEYEVLTETSSLPISDRVKAGQPCPQSGIWASQDVKTMERYYKAGEIMIDLKSAYGLTLWKWVREN